VLLLKSSDQRAQVRLPADAAGLRDGQGLVGALGGSAQRVTGGFLQWELPELSGEILLADSAG
jgi:hypothetical protein